MTTQTISTATFTATITMDGTTIRPFDRAPRAILAEQDDTHARLVVQLPGRVDTVIDIDTSAATTTNDRCTMTRANRLVENYGLFVDVWAPATVHNAKTRRHETRPGLWETRLTSTPTLWD